MKIITIDTKSLVPLTSFEGLKPGMKVVSLKDIAAMRHTGQVISVDRVTRNTLWYTALNNCPSNSANPPSWALHVETKRNLPEWW